MDTGKPSRLATVTVFFERAGKLFKELTVVELPDFQMLL
jgi:hypothetical protein